MANLYITEYQRLGPGFVPAGEEPGIDQVVAYTTATQGPIFADTTNVIRVVSDAKAFIAFGANPTATAANKYIAADLPEYFGVQSGQRLSAYDGTS